MNLTRRTFLHLAALLGVATTMAETEHETEQWIDPAPAALAASGWWPGAG